MGVGLDVGDRSGISVKQRLDLMLLPVVVTRIGLATAAPPRAV